MKSLIEGIVVETDDSKAKVKISRHNDCSNCGACPGENALLLDAENKIHARTGDQVTVEIENDDVLKSAFIVYMLPLLLSGGGVLLGYLASLKLGNELALEICGGVICFILSVIYIKRADRAAAGRQTMPVIIKVNK